MTWYSMYGFQQNFTKHIKGKKNTFLEPNNMTEMLEWSDKGC